MRTFMSNKKTWGNNLMPHILLIVISGILFLGMSTASLIQEPKELNVSTENKAPVKKDYHILILGDSMSRGIDTDQVTKKLSASAPETAFTLENISKEDLSLDKALDQISDKSFDVLILESMAYSPIQANSESESLSKQTALLNQLLAKTRKLNPKSKVIFLTTIAPSKEKFAQGKLKIPKEVSELRAIERQQSIESFIKYAKDHNISLINIYQYSLNSDGSANLDYIDSSDYIHPSKAGIDLIENQITNFLIHQIN